MILKVASFTSGSFENGCEYLEQGRCVSCSCTKCRHGLIRRVDEHAVNRYARMLHEVYSENSPSPVEWKDLSYFLRQSNIAAADHLIVKARYLLDDEDMTELTEADCRRTYERFREVYPERADVLQEMEHRRWLSFYQMFNWSYDPVRDNALRHHPLLLPYDQLPPSEQKKDSFVWEIFGRF